MCVSVSVSVSVCVCVCVCVCVRARVGHRNLVLVFRPSISFAERAQIDF